jgi:hypothetical protein
MDLALLFASVAVWQKLIAISLYALNYSRLFGLGDARFFLRPFIALARAYAHTTVEHPTA